MFNETENQILKQNIKIQSSPRPMRVVYFIEDNRNANSILNEVFEECYGRWGGIDTLIIPFKNKVMPTEYWDWLVQFDPDVIYSYVNISDVLIRKIHQYVLPAHFILHSYGSGHGGSPPRFTPRMETPGIFSLSLIPFFNVRANFLRSKIQTVVDAFPQWIDDGFCGDNFGIASRAGLHKAFPIDSSVGNYVSTLMLTPENAPANRWRFNLPANTKEVTSATELLNALTADAGIVCLSQLANALAPSPTPFRHQTSFNIIIGDSFYDRLLFWNIRLLRQSHESDLHFVALRIPEARLEDAQFIEALNGFLTKKHNFAGIEGGHKHFVLRSTSVSNKKLKAYSDLLRSRSYHHFRFEEKTNLKKLCPKKGQCPSYGYRIGIRDNAPFLQESNQSVFQYKSPSPFHLSEIANVPPYFKHGVWYNDVRISRHENLSVFYNVSHWWKVPRRHSLVDLFISGSDVRSRNEARIDKNGIFCLPSEYFNGSLSISVPSDKDVFYHLLSSPYPARFQDIRKNKLPFKLFGRSSLSEEGRYLNGAVALFGDLNQACHAIKERFWRRMFLDLCDPKKFISSSNASNIRSKIKRDIAGKTTGPLTLSTEEDWDKVMNALITTAYYVRNPVSYFSLERVKELHRLETQQHLEKYPHMLGSRESLESVVQERLPYLTRDIQDFCSSKIFTQGVMHTCKSCGNKNWTTVDELKRIMNCVVCQASFQIPLDYGWDFMLNPFLAKCFREHGTMPLIWALGEINYDSKQLFTFAPPQGLYIRGREEKKTRDAEIDLVCISDGKFIIGEVKPGANSFKKGDFESIVKAANKIVPDQIVLACLEHNPRKMQNHVNTVKGLLPKNSSIGVIYLCPGQDFEDASYV